MRIVIATPFYPPQIGVLATYAEGIEKALKKRGHEAVVVAGGSWQHRPPGVRHIVYFWNVFVALRGATFVLALDIWSVGMPAYCAARLRRVPFVVRIGGDFLWESYVERTRDPIRLSDFYDVPRIFSFKEKCIYSFVHTLVRHAHMLFFNSRFQKDIWQMAYGVPDARSALLENQYPPSMTEKEPPQKRVFVAPIRGAFVKNPGVLVRAFARVQEKYPDISLDMEPLPYSAQLERLKKAYAIIVPSISEISSNMIIEAVSFGRPFITSDGGVRERLGECGLFIDTRSEDELTRAIEQLLDSVEYERLAAKARAFSFVRTWDDIASEILAVIDKTLAKS